MKVAIVGSGVAGISCAKALAARGICATILDVGETLDADRQRIIDDIAGRPIAGWTESEIAALRPQSVSPLGIPPKLAFGSDFIYGRQRAHSPLRLAAGTIPSTYARGGYSTVWGAAVLPAADEDTAAWPVQRVDLQPHYQAVLASIPFSATHDALAGPFPLYAATRAAVAPTAQGAYVLSRVAGAADRLQRAGVWIGQARLMIDGGEGGCVPCGLCLTGCPRGAIHSASSDLQQLQTRGQVLYESGVVVQQVVEDGSGVDVHSTDATSGLSRHARFDRVFLAAGALNTTRIALRSMAAFDRAVTLRDSQKFFTPFRLGSRIRGALGDPRNSLANAFIELRDRQTDHWVHFQLSPHNALVDLALGLGRGGLRRALLAPVVERLMYLWGSLHSDQSGTLTATLRHTGLLDVETTPNEGSGAVARRALQQIAAQRDAIGGSPIRPLMRLSAVGGGGHYGGSFPMTRSGGAFESDLLGRPGRFQRVHCVDASVLPSIPATTIALAVMANAHRIGAAAAQL